MIRSPLLVRDCVYKGISLIFVSQEEVLELIMVFEADEPIINIDKRIRR